MDTHCPPPPLPQIPEEMNRCRNSYVEQALLPRRLEDLTGEEARHGGYRAYLQDSLDALLKEAKDKFKGYDSCSTPEHAELACRKVTMLVYSWTHHSRFSLNFIRSYSCFSVCLCFRGWILCRREKPDHQLICL